MIAILLGLLLSTCVGIVYKSSKDAKLAQEASIEAEREAQALAEAIYVPDYSNEVTDYWDVKQEVMDTIVRYVNIYYKNMSTLTFRNCKEIFADELMAEISNKANMLLVETRKLYDFDFRFDKGYFDIYVTDYWTSGDEYHVSFLEDDHFFFNYLGGIESIAMDVENSFTIIEKNGKYLINDVEKVQGYYSLFEDTYSTDELDVLYERYLDQLKDEIAYEKEQSMIASQNSYISTKTFTKPYDRTKAVAYLDRYYHDRNSEWNDFDDEGGNCQNFASQALLEGNIPMDSYGEYQWKYYGYELNEDNVKEGRSKSWINVPFFYEYALHNEGAGMVAEVGVNLFYSEPGDIIQVGYDGEYVHTTMVSRIVDGHILVDSNSNDLKDYPIDAYVYPNRVLIKILGYNS